MWLLLPVAVADTAAALRLRLLLLPSKTAVSAATPSTVAGLLLPAVVTVAVAVAAVAATLWLLLPAAV